VKKEKLKELFSGIATVIFGTLFFAWVIAVFMRTPIGEHLSAADYVGTYRLSAEQQKEMGVYELKIGDIKIITKSGYGSPDLHGFPVGKLVDVYRKGTDYYIRIKEDPK